jgi:hypothetical protein
MSTTNQTTTSRQPFMVINTNGEVELEDKLHELGNVGYARRNCHFCGLQIWPFKNWASLKVRQEYKRSMCTRHLKEYLINNQ